MKKTIIIVLAASISPALYWIGGFDFDERGAAAVWCAVGALITGLIVSGVIADDGG